jgi:hypothetical protein
MNEEEEEKSNQLEMRYFKIGVFLLLMAAATPILREKVFPSIPDGTGVFILFTAGIALGYAIRECDSRMERGRASAGDYWNELENRYKKKK